MAIPVRQNKRTPSWGGGGGMSAPSGGAASMPGAGAPGPTGWVNVQDYLRANAPQAAQMGTNLAGRLGNEAERAAQQANAYRTQANTYMNAPADKPNPALGPYNAERDKVGGLGGNVAQTAYEIMNAKPAPLVPNQATPPTVPTAPGEVLSKIQAASTPAGLADYFQQNAGPTYNAGQGALDSYLAGAGGGGKALQDLQTKYGKVLDLVRYPYPGALDDGKNRPAGPGPEAGTYPQHPSEDMGLPLHSSGEAISGRRKKIARIA